MTPSTSDQLQNKIDELTISIGKDRLKLITLSDKIQLNIQTKKDLEEQLNTLKYANLDLKNVPWNELLKVDDCGNTNKELKRHINNMMEGLPGINCSSYNVHTLQSVLALYINHSTVSPHYCDLLTNAIDTLLPHITPSVKDRNQRLGNAKFLRITDPDCGEYGTYSLAFTDKWYILVNHRETGNTFPSTKELVQYISQHMAHGNDNS